MSKGKIIGGVVIAVVVLAAIASATGTKNTLAPTLAPVGSSAAATGATTAAPSAAQTTSTSSFGVGDRVKLDDEEYITLEKAEEGFTSDFAKPKAGNINASFLVAFEGINPSGASYNPFYFKVKDDSGFEYNFTAFGKEPQLASSNGLQPGKISRGWMTFEVPKAAKTLTLSYTPGVTGQPVEFVYKP
jgi:uncharacterized protein DUF4352